MNRIKNAIKLLDEIIEIEELSCADKVPQSLRKIEGPSWADFENKLQEASEIRHDKLKKVIKHLKKELESSLVK